MAWSTGYEGSDWGKMISDGTYLYVDNGGKVAQTNLSDGIINNPAFASGFAEDGVGALAISRTTLYVAEDGTGTIWTYTTGTGNPNEQNYADGFSNFISSLAILGDYLYVGSNGVIGRVHKTDSNDKSTDWLIDDRLGFFLFAMYSYNNLLYVLTSTAILTVDSSGTISTIYTITSEDVGYGLVIYNNIMYVSLLNTAIATFQIDGTPINMSWQLTDKVRSLALNGSDLYWSSADFVESIFNVYKITLTPPPPPPAMVCFKEGSKILTDLGYVPIETLRPGDRVMTALNGYKAVEMIGKREMFHLGLKDRIKDQLYKCSAPAFPEVFEDLVITGCHSILVDDFTSLEQRQKTAEVNNNIYITGNKYRLPACVDDRTTVYEEKGTHMIYHLALENEDYYMNYGIYANGLLVETCSHRYLKELSNMELIQ